ncbi:type II toxin-antitoxin system VapC family toxin [Candidatus Peregrinibacteria bacterium]|nr:type II toxin-antitoxin system VapC family toxin [Candidatus Peregrinibacteria bacterium]
MSGDNVLFVDTNVIVDFLNRDMAVVDLLNRYSALYGLLFVSVIVEIEALSFSRLSEDEVYFLKNFFKSNFHSVNLDSNIADITAALRRESKIKLPDALIAATAISMKASLLTRNIKDFKNIPGLKILSI